MIGTLKSKRHRPRFESTETYVSKFIFVLTVILNSLQIARYWVLSTKPLPQLEHQRSANAALNN
ncbi:hypothetical protein BDZ94DRAFT_1245634 [Collybia nuda]|uniref:Uncharacterized protein n=1 Tax=Collybia nuda TaxID=64659 RepID=A0A9P5YEK3_9AGAR|nr:hypothetical protein BDZ94DRAFT_1245634 [Collybia nuda]